MTNEEFQKVVLDEFKKLNGRMDDLEGEMKQLNSRIDRLEKTVDSIHKQTVGLVEFREETRINFEKLNNRIDEVDAKHSDKHLVLTKEFNELKTSVNRIEVNTAENWRDIAILKSVK